MHHISVLKNIGNLKMCKKVVILALFISAFSCSHIRSTYRARLNLESRKSLTSSGSFTIVGQVPKFSKRSVSSSKKILSITQSEDNSLVIDRLSGTLLLSRGNKILRKFEFLKGLGKLKKGALTVASIEESPVWNAPDEYFTNRNMDIPEIGAIERELKGALGEIALRLSDNTILHNSPIWTNEIGGIKVSDNELKILSNYLKVGSKVLVL